MRQIVTKHFLRYWNDIVTPVILGILLFAVAFASLSLHDVERASTISQETLEMLYRRVVRYDGYRANDETKSLVRLLDKTTELAQRLARVSKQNKDFLDQYAYEQRLSGILILDEERNIVLASTGAEDEEAQQCVRQGPNIQQVIDYPVKNYITHTVWKGVEYDVVAVARQGEEKGVVICYSSKNSIKNNQNDITFETLLDGYTFELNGIGGITDGTTFISSNPEDVESLDRKSVV